MSAADFHANSQKIISHLNQAVDFASIRILHSFLPMLTRREPDLWPLLEDLRKNQIGLQIAVPRVKGTELENVLLTPETILNSGSYGITEPADGKPIDPTSIDIVLVPVLLADTCGNRLGYGKGYYDRFLSVCRKECVKIGLSILDPVAKVPSEPHDIRLDKLVSPAGVLTFG